jgi:hypothetical protein
MQRVILLAFIQLRLYIAQMLWLDYVVLKGWGSKRLKDRVSLDIFMTALSALKARHPKGPLPLDELLADTITQAYARGVLDTQHPFWQCGRCVRANDEGKEYCGQCGARRP